MHDSAEKLLPLENYPVDLEDMSIKQFPTRISIAYINLIRAKANVEDRTLKSTIERAIRLYCLGSAETP